MLVPLTLQFLSKQSWMCFHTEEGNLVREFLK